MMNCELIGIETPVVGNRGFESMPSAVYLQLSGSIDRTAIERLFARIVATLSTTKRLVIDCRQSERIDLEGISTLCGVHRYVAARGCDLDIEGLDTRIVQRAIAENRGFTPWSNCSANHLSRCLWLNTENGHDQEDQG
jgi:ABC-type transporter Mla MlaB component